jgi:hypothetical protein
MAQIDSSIPMSYQFGPSIGEHFKQAVSIADMMDQRKSRELERKAKIQDMEQGAELYPLQLQQAQQGLKNAQQTYNQNEQTNPLEVQQKRNALTQWATQYQQDIEEYDRKKDEIDETLMAKMAKIVNDQATFDHFNYALQKMGREPFEYGQVYDENAKMNLNSLIAKRGDAKGSSTASVFEPGSQEYNLADKIAKGQITWNQGLQAFVGFGNKTGKREDLINTIFEINPDYKSSDAEGAYRAAITSAQIPARAAGSYATAGASETGKRDVGKTLSETASERLGDFGSSHGQLDVLIKSFSNPEAPQGPISQIRKANPYDWQAQAKQQLIASTKQLIGKALEGGVLRKEDEEKYNKILPIMGDTYKSAVAKAENLSNMLNVAYKAKRRALKYAGYYVEDFPETYKNDNKSNNVDLNKFWK